MTDRRDDARSAGRGLLSIAGAKVYFIVTSYAVQLTLPHLWSTSDFGLFAATIAAVSILNNVLIAATIQSVSKFVSEDEDNAGVRLREGLRLQLVIGTVLGGVFFLLSPVLADFLKDPRLADLFRISSAVVFSYALYAALVGSLNGRRLFQRQARLDMTFSTMRTAGILATAILGFGVMGSVAGFASAAVTILAVALIFVGIGGKGEPLPLRRWLAFMAPIWIYQIFLNAMLQADILVLKKTLAEIGLDAGLVAQAAAEQADDFVGRYRAAQTFAFVPYQLMLSMTFIVFPMVSRATSSGDDEAARATIRAALRFSLLMLLAIAAPVAGAADGVLLIAYPHEYVALGAPALSVLVFGMVSFALFVICSTVLSGAGRPALAATIAGLSVIVVVGANRLMVQAVGMGPSTLQVAASATTTGTTLAFIASAVVVYLRFRALFPVATVVRAVLASGIAYAVAALVPHQSRLTAVAALAAGFAAYGVALVITREIRAVDLAAARRIVGRKG